MKPPRKTRPNGVAREDILAAATELFAEHGFAAVTLREIAQKARVHLPAIYAHFTDKRALYMTCCMRVSTQPNTDLAAALDDRQDDEANILAFATAMAKVNIENPTLTKLMQRQVLDGDETLVDMILQGAMSSYYSRVLGIMRRLVGDAADEKTFAIIALTSGAHQLSSFDTGAAHAQLLKKADTLATFVLGIVLPGVDWARVAAGRRRKRNA